MREAAILGAARRFGWSHVESTAARLAICAVSVAVVTEAASYLLRWPGSFMIGGFPVSPSVVPLGVAGVLGGARSLGRPRSAEAARTFWVLHVMVLAVAATSLSGGREPAAVVSLLLTGFVEEFMYRGAIPAVAAYALARHGLPARRAGVLGLAVGGTCFVFLPGHVNQWHTVADVLPFVAFAIIAAMAVWRTGALFEVALLHAVLNTVNIGRLDGVSDPAGAMLLAALMAVLVIAYVPSSYETRLVIDLTGDEPEVTNRRHVRVQPSITMVD